MSVGSYTKQSAGGGMITIQSSAANLKAFQDFAKVVPKAAAAAQRRAINKTLGWLRTHIARAVSRQEKIAVTAVRQRLRSYPVRGGSSQGKLWFGINPLEASRIGRPNQTASGVSVGGRRYKGAFYKRVYGSNADIWIRTGSKQFSAEDYPGSTDGRRTSGFVNEAYGRFPLAKAKVMLENIRPLFNTWSRLADERLLEILRQELNYELQKYLKGAGRV
ncbi:MAG: phage tail protein [Pseudomonas sp.]